MTMKNIEIPLDKFCILMTVDDNDDIVSLLFSEDLITPNYTKVVPPYILSDDRTYSYDTNHTNKWWRYNYKEDGAYFQSVELSIEIDGYKFRIGIIANNFSEIIYAERIKSNYNGHELKTSSFFEKILQITNHDLKIKFIDKAGKILLSTYINDDKHKNRGLDVQKCNRFAYININGEWQKYDSNLNLIQRIPEWNNCRVEAFPYGQYSYINIHSYDGFSGDDKDNIKQCCLFNPSGEVVYSDTTGNIQHMRFLKDADYFYLEKYGCTGTDLTRIKKTKVFFYKEKYLFDIVESRHYDNVFLSDQRSLFAAFIANGGVNGQNYGLVDSNFEIILPFVFEDIYSSPLLRPNFELVKSRDFC